MGGNITEIAVWAADSTIEMFSEVLAPETMADEETKWRMVEFAMDSFRGVRDGWGAEDVKSAMEIIKDKIIYGYTN